MRIQSAFLFVLLFIPTLGFSQARFPDICPTCPLSGAGTITLTSTDNGNYTNTVDCSGGDTVVLPSAADTDYQYSIRRTNSAAGDCTIDPDMSETIDGASTYILKNQNDFVWLISDGTNWLINSYGTVTAYSTSEASATSWTVAGTTHRLGTCDLTYEITSTSGTVRSKLEPSAISCETNAGGTQYDVTVTFTNAQAGNITMTRSGGFGVSACPNCLTNPATAAQGGTGDDTSGTTGVPRITAGNWTYDAGISHLAASSSSDLRGVLNDENGTGAALFNGAATFSVSGVTLSDMTAGSLLFAGTSGLVSQDNTNFFWNNSAKRFFVGPRSGLPTRFQTDYINDAHNILGITDPASPLNVANLLYGIDTVGNSLAGSMNAVYSTHTTGTALFNYGEEAHAIHDGSGGTVTTLGGLYTYAENAAGIVTDLAGVVVESNFDNDLATNNYGILVKNQGSSGAANNWAIKTGTGTVSLGDFLEIQASDPADSGAIRLDNNEGVCWEASPAGTDVCIAADASEIMQITGGTLDGGDIANGTVGDSALAAGAVDGGSGGEIADGSIDSNDLATANKTLEKSITVLDPTTGHTNKVQWYWPAAVTLNRIACSVDAGTSATINFDERAEATPNTAGTDTLSAGLVCDTNSQTSCASGCDVNTISDSGIAADVPHNLQITAVSGAVTALRIHLRGTIN